jgi:hypothetical protein
MLVKLAARTAAATKRAWRKPGIMGADGRENRETNVVAVNGAKRASKVGARGEKRAKRRW